MYFSENKDNPFIIEPTDEKYGELKGKWSEEFHNSNPVVLEIGCGRGEYTTGLARINPEINYIGIDLKGDRMYHGAKDAQVEGLKNVRFLRTRIELLENFFEENEVKEIWITFPGPRPKKSEANRRLTTQKFLNIYKNILVPGGVINVKTDSDFVYEYTKEQVGLRTDIETLIDTDDLYESNYAELHQGITTQFERRFLAEGKNIHYLKLKFSGSRGFLKRLAKWLKL